MRTFTEQELERVHTCAGCGAALGDSTIHGARDTAFANVDGAWDFTRCAACGSLQLTPRPVPLAIHRAYDSYYTHGDSDDNKPAATSLRERVVDRWTTGFEEPLLGSPPLALLMKLALLAGDFRGLDRARGSLRILDVGCGDGNFLARAKRRGHSVVGIDFDLKAVAAARARGIDCTVGTIADLLPARRESFDLVTASHVIEHVYDPGPFLAQCFELLKPGGILWLETPNANAWGRRIYRENWRGLEVPRHLSVLSLDALRRLAAHAGFTQVRSHWTGLVSPYFFSRSEQARKSGTLASSQPLAIRPSLIAAAVVADLLRAVVGRGAQECITLTAHKPG